MPFFVATLVAAFNLRIALVGVGPVIEDIRADVQMSSAAAGLLTMIPILCMSGFAFFGVPVIRRLGSARVITGCLALIGVGTIVRAVMPSGWSLIVATLPIGVGLALAGVALPAIVKRHFPSRGGQVTGAYVASMTFAAALFSFTVVPLADALGGWREAFVASALPVAIALPIWVAFGAGEQASAARSDVRRARRPGLVALLALLFGLQAVPYTTMISWVAGIYRDAGWAPADAALATGLIALLAVPSAILIPGLSDRRDRRPWIATMAALVAVGVLGVALAPTAMPLAWLILFGIGNGALFALVLTLPVDLGRDPGEVARLSVWMMGLGYLMAAAAPVVVGALRDLSGGFELPMTLVAGVAAIAAIAVVLLPRGAPARSDPAGRLKSLP